MFDHDISPVSFGPESMFHCISVRFERRPTETQEQALNWLQLLSQMEIVIPIDILLKMFTKGEQEINKEYTDGQMDGGTD